MPLSPRVVTVSQLNHHIKNYLEREIGVVSVQGELSNLSKPASGHLYFTLKDTLAQIRCVFFKNRHPGSVIASIKDGQQVTVSGTLSLYEARGDYQLIVDELSDAGLGELYLQFEALKNKLAAEGLFNPEGKKSLPKIPQSIGIITSPNGAALQDILSTLARRFPLAKVFIYPSEVQGATAAEQLTRAVQQANKQVVCDVLILARGGGSIEDLWAFNNEALARQIAASTIPIVSGVGHETDFTITDFVADYRAETPTAAATVVTPHRDELLLQVTGFVSRFKQALAGQMRNHQLTLAHLTNKVASPNQIIAVYWQKIDYLEQQLQFQMHQLLYKKRQNLLTYTTRVQFQSPVYKLQHIKSRLDQLMRQLTQKIKGEVQSLRHHLNKNLSTLHAVSPLATLDRGYSITTHQDKVIDDIKSLHLGDLVSIRLAQGLLGCEIRTITELHHD